MCLQKPPSSIIIHLPGIRVQAGTALIHRDSRHHSAARFQAQFPLQPVRRVHLQAAAAHPEVEVGAEAEAAGNRVCLNHCHIAFISPS